MKNDNSYFDYLFCVISGTLLSDVGVTRSLSVSIMIVGLVLVLRWIGDK